MVSIRIHGSKEAVEKIKKELEEQLNVLSSSAPYKDRGESKLVRVYVTCEAKEEQKTKEI